MPEKYIYYDPETNEYVTKKMLIKEMRAERKRKSMIRFFKRLLIAIGLIIMPIAGWLIFNEPEVLICELCAIPVGVLYVLGK